MSARNIFRVFLVLALLSVALAAPAARAEEGAISEADQPIQKKIYYYQSGSIRDPFFSIIEQAKLKQQSATGVELPPIQSYDLSQMRLMAVVINKRNKYALVALPDGKFYTVNEGMGMGIHAGIIHEIVGDAVIVREQIPDFRGIMQDQDTELRLRAREE
jgi:Tfp pilus assembly protein PilP